MRQCYPGFVVALSDEIVSEVDLGVAALVEELEIVDHGE